MQCDRRVKLRRLLIAGWKIFIGGFDLVAGLFLISVSDRRLTAWAEQLAEEEWRGDLGDRLAVLLDQWVPALIDRKTSVALVLLAVGAASLVAAVGFLRGRRWGYHAILALVGGFMCLDVPHLIRRPSLIAVIIVSANAVVLWALVRYRKSFLEC